MTFVEAVRSALSKYVVFTGRATRAEYWWFTLFSTLAQLAANLLGDLVSVPYLDSVVNLALFLPTIAVTVRRLHDSDKSGWWLLGGVVAYGTALVVLVVGVLIGFGLDGSAPATVTGIGLVILAAILVIAVFVTALVFMLLPSTPGPNRYDPGYGMPPYLGPGTGPYDFHGGAEPHRGYGPPRGPDYGPMP